MFFNFLRHWFHEGTSIYKVWSKMTKHDHNLPMFLWAKESMTSMYVHNKIPHKTLRNMTPKEAFTRVNFKVSHFRIFGCMVYIHVPRIKGSS
jgi:hypothetical protein